MIVSSVVPVPPWPALPGLSMNGYIFASFILFFFFASALAIPNSSMIAVSTTMKHSPASLFCLPASIVERFRLQVDEACQPRMHVPAQLRVFDLVDFIERGFQESHSLSQVQSRPVLQLLCAGPQHVALHLDPLRLGGDEGIVNAGIHRGGAGLAALYFTIFRAARSFSTSENARIFFTASGTASISFISTASSNRPRATMAIACRSLALFRDNRVSMWAYGQRTRSV
jgi:hypothetical protein